MLRLGAAQVAIGAAAIFARYALLGAGPLAVAALRLAIAALAMLVVVRRMPGLSRKRELAFALAGFALALHFGTWIASLSYTSVAASTLLVTTTPLWTAVFDIVRERRAPPKSVAIALVIGLAGVALVTSQQSGRPPVPGHESVGDALALLGSVAIGAYLLVIRDAARDRRGVRLPTRHIVTRTYAWAALASIVAAAAAHQAPPALTNVTAWSGIIAMALISQLIGHTALNASLATFTPTIVALSTLCEPIAAALFAALFFHETLGLGTIAGGLLVLGAVAIALRSETAPARTYSNGP
jgi:drug/metabolite transporter (DMT)-like permease